jgi:YesN/AraC family two-component response regulator
VRVMTETETERVDDYVSKPSRRRELRSALDRVATTAVRQLDDDDVLRTLIEEDGEDVFDRLVDLFIASAPNRAGRHASCSR